MAVHIIVAMLLAAILLSVLAYQGRNKSISSLREINERLCIYRKIRHALGVHMLVFYPSLIQSDLRMRLLKQLDIYASLDDDEAEKRWERLWLPKLLRVSEDLAKSDLARQDTEFSETIDGFRTNERLIADARLQRNKIISRPVISCYPNDDDIRDSHHVSSMGDTQKTNSRADI